MNREQAQLILLAYRRGEPVPDESDMGRALALAAGDPSLADWLEQELEMDSRIRESMREVKPPAGLRDQILSKTKILRISWWRRPSALAAAAGLLAVVGSATWWLSAPRLASAPSAKVAGRRASGTLDEFRAEMVRLVSTGGYHLDLNTRRLGEVKEYLASRGRGVGAQLPAALERLGTYGCQVLDWNGETVTLICFRAGEVQIAHLLVIDARAVRDPLVSEAITLASVGTWSTAGWRDGEKVLIVCSPAGGAELRRFLGG